MWILWCDCLVNNGITKVMRNEWPLGPENAVREFDNDYASVYCDSPEAIVRAKNLLHAA